MSLPGFMFKNKMITGYIDDLNVPSFDSKTNRQFHWGTAGETEVRGGLGGRNITFNILLASAEHTTLSGFRNNLKNVHNLENEHGILQVFRIVNGQLELLDSFPNCTFDGYRPLSYGGRGSVAPQFDILGSLAGVPSWYFYVEMKFRQLSDQVNA